MFKIRQTNSFIWPVKLVTPVSGGKYTTSTFDIEFKRLSQTEVSKLAEDIQSDERTAHQIVRDIVVGWPDGSITDGDDDLPFSVSALDQLLEVPMCAGAILSAFLEAYNGQAAKRKN